jgi:hypothetical protein
MDLESLSIYGLPHLIDVSSLSACPKLKTLKLEGCESLDLNTMPDRMEALESLTACCDCRFLPAEDKMFAYDALSSLTLVEKCVVANYWLSPFGNCVALKKLHVGFLRGSELTAVPLLCNLEELVVTNWHGTSALYGAEAFVRLEKLDICSWYSDNVDMLPFLSDASIQDNVKELKFISMERMEVPLRLTLLGHLASFAQLTHLSIINLFDESDTDVDKFAIGHALATVVADCEKLTLLSIQ